MMQTDREFFNWAVANGDPSVHHWIAEDYSVNNCTSESFSTAVMNGFHTVDTLVKNGFPVKVCNHNSFSVAVKKGQWTAELLVEYGFPVKACSLKAFSYAVEWKHPTAYTLVKYGYLNYFTLEMYYELKSSLPRLNLDADKLFSRSQIIPVLSSAVRTKQLNINMAQLILSFCANFLTEDLNKIVEIAVFDKIIMSPTNLI
jgi:hypothetical protein